MLHRPTIRTHVRPDPQEQDETTKRCKTSEKALILTTEFNYAETANERIMLELIL